MMLLATLVGIASVAFYLIKIGKDLNNAKLSDEAIRDIQKAYKLERQEDRATQEKLDGNNADPDSVASLFPDELQFTPSEGRDNEGLRQTSSSKD